MLRNYALVSYFNNLQPFIGHLGGKTSTSMGQISVYVQKENFKPPFLAPRCSISIAVSGGANSKGSDILLTPIGDMQKIN